MVPTAPEENRSVVVLAVGTSASGRRDRGTVTSTADTASTSPTSTRARSNRCVVCSTTWPPERSRRAHQGAAGVPSSQ
jgi:hypothetical protein